MFDINLSDVQLKKLNAFIKENRKPNGHGTIGGEFTYCFTPTSLGVVIKVKHVNGKEIDLTEYEDW
jgi:hypothetical protein